MRVCFATYPTAFQQPGGGERVLLSLRAALERKGVDVALFDPWATQLAAYDILHYFSTYGVDVMPMLRRYVRCLAVTPFFWPALPRTIRLERNIRRILGRAMKRAENNPLAAADIVFPTSKREGELLAQNYGVDPGRISVVPHGVDSRFAVEPTGAFAREYGLGRYVLCPGRVDPNKNQLRVVRALAEIELDIVILGDEAPGASGYYAACRAVAGPRTNFVASLPPGSQLLVDAFAAAACVVIASEYELCSLAALDAGLAGVPLASTTGGGMLEHLSPFAVFFDPLDEREIEMAVREAVARGRVPGQREHFARTFSWDEIADRTLAAYETASDQ